MDRTVTDLKDERVPPCLYWSIEQVADWVEQLGFPHYRSCFETNLINGRKLSQVHSSSLPQLGVKEFEHIKIITKGIRDLLTIDYPDWHRSISLPPKESLGLYLEAKSVTGEKSDDTTYAKFMLTFDEQKWQPPLSNQCLMLPHDTQSLVEL